MVLSSFTLGVSMISFDNTTQSYIVTFSCGKVIRCKNYQTARAYALGVIGA
jgi:hypothetical protein